MVAFSHLALILAGTGLSTAQSFSGPPPSGTIPSGAPFPTGGFPEGPGHEHSGHHGGFPHPTGGFHPHGPKPSGTGIFGVQRAQQSDEAPFPKGPDFSAFPSGAARPSGHHHPGHHSGHHSGFPHPTGGFHPHGPRPSGTAIVGAKRAEASDEAPFPNGPEFSTFPSGAAKPSGHHHHGHHSGFPYPTGGFHHPHGPKPSGTGVFGAQEAHRSGEAPFPSGTDFPAFPSGAARPSGHHGHHGHHGEGGKGGHHSGRPSGLPSGVPTTLPSLAARAEGSLAPKPTGALPTGPHPSGAPPAGPRPSGARPPHASGSPPPRPSGARPSGPPPSGKPTAAPSHARHSTFVTSVTRAI